MAKIELAHLKELAEMSEPIFTTRIAFTIMIFAMLLAQQLAVDQRASHQSKVIGEHLYKTNGLRIDRGGLPRTGPGNETEYQKTVWGHAKRYEG